MQIFAQHCIFVSCRCTMVFVPAFFVHRHIQQLKARSEALEARLDASTCESGQALRRANRQESEVAALAADLEALQRQLHKQQEAAEAEVDALQQALQQQRAQAQAEVQALQQQLEAARHEARNSEAAVADQQSRSRDVQASCSRQMHELEARVQEAIRQAQEADRERQRLVTEVTAAEVGSARLTVREAPSRLSSVTACEEG